MGDPADRLRVALLAREYPPEVYGGAGVHLEYLARALQTEVDVDVHCFGAPREDPTVAGTYTHWDALEGEAPYLSALRTISTDLVMAAAIEGADVVHSHTWYANLAGHLASLTFGIPHVMTSHSLEPLRPWKAEQLGGGYQLSLFCERTAAEAADAIIAVSAQMRDDVLVAYPSVDPDRVQVIHNGIDVDEYRPDRATDVCERIGMDPARPSAVFVGRITRQKGITHLLDAAAHLDDGTQLVLLAGAPDTPEIGAEFRDRVQQLQADGLDVLWIEKMLPRPEVVQVLSHATVFVCPSIYEPFGLVNVEAMGCEAAVVASAVGGIPEVVVDGETGLLVPFGAGDDAFGSPADPDGFARSLAHAVNALLGDPDRARAMGRAGRQRAIDAFSWSSVAERTAALYRGLLA
ncbi:glycogen synthase [soil metagenome]